MDFRGQKWNFSKSDGMGESTTNRGKPLKQGVNDFKDRAAVLAGGGERNPATFGGTVQKVCQKRRGMREWSLKG
jgi:hypothetical protein